MAGSAKLGRFFFLAAIGGRRRLGAFWNHAARSRRASNSRSLAINSARRTMRWARIVFVPFERNDTRTLELIRNEENNSCGDSRKPYRVLCILFRIG